MITNPPFDSGGSYARINGMTPEGWLTVTEAASRKGLEPQQIRDLIKNGRLPAEKTGSIWLIRIKDIDELEMRGQGRPKKPRGRPRKNK